MSAEKTGWLSKLRKGLSRSSNSLSGGIADFLTKQKLDQATLDDLEDILIQADLGVETAMSISETISKMRYEKDLDDHDIRMILQKEVENALIPVAAPYPEIQTGILNIILICGVNGSGKTTTIGKLASHYTRQGHKVMLAAGDTFRAAATEQLKIWGERIGADVIAKDMGADAASLVFEAIHEAKEAKADILLIDTAGRLQNKSDLMDELHKILRLIQRQDENAPHHILLILDATIGQNALSQVKVFHERVKLTGLIMTKLDGTARGGILIPIAKQFGLPIHAIGVGEGVEDLQPFKAEDFAKAIAGVE